jgi:pimeloyl-ACP methyl ester carboxylesterase
MKTVAYVHGLNSSYRSFAYLTQNLPEHNIIKVDYNSHQSLVDSLLDVRKQLPKTPLSLIGHSLGGLISTLLVLNEPERFESLVTISSPLGGSRAANYMRWMPGHPAILDHITPGSAHIQQLATFQTEVPTLSIISTGGHLPMTSEANDSVVTVHSQRALLFGKKIEVKANHFEVLMHEKTLEAIAKHLFGASNG